MISRSALSCQIPAWRKAMAGCITDPAELLQILQLPTSLLPQARAAHRLFPLRVPRGFVRLMRKGDPHDPLLRQVLPLTDELSPHDGFGPDPLAEGQAVLGNGLLQKYHGRVLLIASPACAVHCRYCFRREYPYGENQTTKSNWALALQQIRQDSSISEVILSGGDPLTLDDQRLAAMIGDLDDIPQLRRLRIHTRLPIVLPERLTEHLADALRATRLGSIMVLHCNHPAELSPALRAGLQRLPANTRVLNQSVLLSGVNDQTDILQRLSEDLFDCGVLPYYLHLLDHARGTGHFEVSQARAVKLMQQMQASLPGYLVPRLVREQAGMPNKTPIL